jgi:GntR family transcriptional regulator/MocR family aminotransferase
VDFVLDLHERGGSVGNRVSQALVGAIAGGQLHEGDRLPSTRMLASTFGIARSAVVQSYEELVAAGFLIARPGGFTFVECGAVASARAGAFGEPLPSPPHRRNPPARPVVYDLRPGHADEGLIYERDWARAVRWAGANARQVELGPGDAEETAAGGDGRHVVLREHLSDYLRRSRSLAVDADDIHLFANVAIALEAVASACGLTGTTVAFEDPGYVSARTALDRSGVHVRSVAVDHDGIRPQDLCSSDRAVYVTPAHQFPLGGRMPVTRRAALLNWALENGSLVLEDDYDGEFRYDVPPLTPLRGMGSGTEQVVYVGTSSKSLSGVLRVSWVVVPSRFRDAMRQFVGRFGDTVSTLSAGVLANYMATGAIIRHQARAMRTYKARQSRFSLACAAHVRGVDVLGSTPASTWSWRSPTPSMMWRSHTVLPTKDWPACRCPDSLPIPSRPPALAWSAGTREFRRPRPMLRRGSSHELSGNSARLRPAGRASVAAC